MLATAVADVRLVVAIPIIGSSPVHRRSRPC
jgi:hypothetical protein